MVLRKLSQTFMVSLAFMVATFSSGLLQPAVAYATPGNGQETCESTSFTESAGGWVKYDNLSSTTFDVPQKTGFTVTDICYKSSTSVVNPGVSTTVTSTVTNDKGKVQDLSHVSVYYTATIHDECPLLTGNQPRGTSCTAPANDKEYQSLPGVVDCTDKEVTVQNQERTRSYTWDGSAWVAGEWSAWVNTTVNVTVATEEQCPTHDECPQLSGNQPVGTSCTAPANDKETRSLDGVVDCEEDTVTVQKQERTRSYTWDGDSWEPGAWSEWTNTTTTVTEPNERQCPSEEEPKKVFVCKYVGTPGIDERLQTGTNPISVSVSSIEHNQWDGTVPGWFSDAHDRSYVLSYDNTAPGPEGDPDVSECPGGDSEEPQADIDYALVCVEGGVKVTLTNSGDASGTATVNGTVYTVAANSSEEVVLDYDLGTPFMTEVTVTIGQDTEVETVNCTPGGGGGNPETPVTPTTPGQKLGTTTTTAAAVLPAILPATGGVDSPFMILVASVLAFGATYFLQGRRLLGRQEAIQN